MQSEPLPEKSTEVVFLGLVESLTPKLKDECIYTVLKLPAPETVVASNSKPSNMSLYPKD